MNLKKGEGVRLKKELMFRVTPLTKPVVLHQHFEVGTNGTVIFVNESSVRLSEPAFVGSISAIGRPGSVTVRLGDTYGKYYHSVSFIGDDQIEEYLERVG